MRKNLPPERPAKFSSSNRHYHRAGSGPQRSWDDWVEGRQVRKASSGKRWKLLGIVIALLALAGIVTGLVIELL